MSIFADTVVLATHNQGKVPEIEYYIKEYFKQIQIAGDFNLDEPEETDNTFAGNALIKARYVTGKTGFLSLADDSGLCVNALNGQPGVLSSRWGGPTKDFGKACSDVLRLLDEKGDRSAYFVSVLALAWPDGRVETFEGRVHGHIIDGKPRGDKGFGYDPIFIQDGDTRTFGEIDFEEKQKISHRARAMDGLIQFLNNG